jgi:hypothetical protein
VDETGMIRNQMETHNRSEIVAVLGTPCAIPSRNSNSAEMVKTFLKLLRVYSIK